ncbi:caspase-3-like [Glandiceps talaboti]
MKEFVDVFEALERKDVIGPRKYLLLKTMLKDINLNKLVEDIEDAEKEQDMMTGSDNLSAIAEPPALSVPIASASSAPGQPPVKMPLLDKGDGRPSEELLHQRAKNSYRRGPGLVVIISNFIEERDGAKVDEGNLKCIFEDVLHYKVLTPRQDMKKEEFQNYLATIRRKIQDDLDLENTEYSSLVVCVSSHGSEAGVRTMDKPIKTFISFDDIITQFNGENCKQMIGKPKVFLFQCCRGDASGKGVRDIADADPEMDVADYLPCIRSTPVNADMLVAYASSYGTKAWRNGVEGTWFIHELCNVIRKDYHSEHLIEMFATVNGLVANRESTEDKAKQMPEQVTTLTKKFYL